ncbi:helix-turn-helix transcriptional regulator [Streptomyces sp. 549]|uniref:helix-turn-helix transcriptional regulator n=1 Tax=Streptomyces sp. 549 TaxID=3049076 RepID=UPI0024C37820|nr:helix-turn-helix transcriptional regulator [Streptomyces sp. 549]MDK1472450.1 helix-turn-helix transcriptional regulator [Streptomyces sp. 549]
MPGPKKLDPGASVAALLGTKVRKLRSRAALTQRDLGTKVFVTHTRIAQIELGTAPPNRRLTESLDLALKAEGDLLDIWDLLDYSPLPQWAERYVRLESEAVEICKSSAVVPGLLQTEGYARAMLNTGRPGCEEVLQARVATRLGRQNVLDRTEAPVLWCIIDESVVRRPVGGREEMRSQLAHLVQAAARPRVVLQVLPFDQGEYAAMDGALTVLTLSDGRRVAYLEGHNSGVLVENQARVSELALTYDLLRAQALPPDRSVAMIREAMEDGC